MGSAQTCILSVDFCAKIRHLEAGSKAGPPGGGVVLPAPRRRKLGTLARAQPLAANALKRLRKMTCHDYQSEPNKST